MDYEPITKTQIRIDDSYGSLLSIDSNGLGSSIIIEEGLSIPIPTVEESRRGSETNLSYLSRRLPFIVVAVASAIILIAWKTNHGSTSIKKMEPFSRYKGTIALQYSLYRRDYSDLPYFRNNADQMAIYRFLSQFKAIIEPYVDMMLIVYDADENIASYTYKVCDELTTSASCYEGDYSPYTSEESESVAINLGINIPCRPFDTYLMEVKGYDAAGSLIVTSTDRAVCMYVRRELRDLTTKDLNETLDVMHTLWEISDASGHQLYGENYHSSRYFSIAHDFNAGQRDADHIHQGLGFIPQHIKLTNMFESSMQAVNPAVTLP